MSFVSEWPTLEEMTLHGFWPLPIIHPHPWPQNLIGRKYCLNTGMAGFWARQPRTDAHGPKDVCKTQNFLRTRGLVFHRKSGVGVWTGAFWSIGVYLSVKLREKDALKGLELFSLWARCSSRWCWGWPNSGTPDVFHCRITRSCRQRK